MWLWSRWILALSNGVSLICWIYCLFCHFCSFFDLNCDLNCFSKCKLTPFFFENSFQKASFCIEQINLVHIASSCGFSISENSQVSASCRILAANCVMDSPDFRFKSLQNLCRSLMTNNLGSKCSTINFASVSMSTSFILIGGCCWDDKFCSNL